MDSDPIAIPLLLRLKRPLPDAEVPYVYDHDALLNVVGPDRTPFVLTVDGMRSAKTVLEGKRGED